MLSVLLAQDRNSLAQPCEERALSLPHVAIDFLCQVLLRIGHQTEGKLGYGLMQGHRTCSQSQVLTQGQSRPSPEVPSAGILFSLVMSQTGPMMFP